MIFGRPGGGKSTFALALHKKTGIPLHHLDKHFYESNWIERNYQEFLQIQDSIVCQELWIIDGNSIRSLEMRYCRADLIVYFQYPRLLCYWRILKRLFNKNSEIDDRAKGCKETINWGLLSYIWTFEKRVAKQIQRLMWKYPKTKFVEINSDKTLKKLKGELWGELF